MSIPEPTRAFTTPAGWYPTGETGPDGRPVERWWDGAQWSTTVRPYAGGPPGGGPFGPVGPGGPGTPRSSRTKGLIAAGVAVVVVVAGVAIYLSTNHTTSTPPSASATAPNTPQTLPTPGSGGGGGNGNGNGGLGGGTGGLGGQNGATPTPMPTVPGGSGKTVSDPIDGLTIPVPTGWTGTSGAATGQGVWPTLITQPYSCPGGLATPNADGTAPTCTAGGVNFTTTTGDTAQAVVTNDIAAMAKSNYGTLTSHTVVNQGAITVAGRAGYQITWSVVPSYTGPAGTVEAIAIPVPGQTGAFALIDIGVDQSAQAPTLSDVNSQIIAAITDASGTGT
ncbi:MAG TPA: hypothetical protein VGX23_22395 [Actinocrinis sp.]|nr:hypothetical protein [Actinocrinis sp.]